MKEELSASVGELTRPSRVEVIRAKGVLLERLSDGELHQSQDLLADVATAFGAPEPTR